MSVIHLRKDNFDAEIVESKQLAVVVFWAPWCGPCRDMAPKVQNIAKEFGDKIIVAKVNVDEHPELGKRYNVNGIPHTALFADGKECRCLVGNVEEAWLRSAVQKHIDKYGNPATPEPAVADKSPEEKQEAASEGIKEALNSADSNSAEPPTVDTTKPTADTTKKRGVISAFLAALFARFRK